MNLKLRKYAIRQLSNNFSVFTFHHSTFDISHFPSSASAINLVVKHSLSFEMNPNRFFDWFAKNDWEGACEGMIFKTLLPPPEFKTQLQEINHLGHHPLHILATKCQVRVRSVGIDLCEIVAECVHIFPQALATLSHDNETPLDIARRTALLIFCRSFPPLLWLLRS